jgi:long-chain fatty acid transport protein
LQRSTPILLALVLSAASTPALAGGFFTAHYGGEHGHVATEHPTAIYFNPAGLALGTGWRIYAEGILAWRTAEYERPASAISNVAGEGEAGTPEDAVSVNSGKASLSNFAASPFLGVITDFGIPNLGVGVGAYVPFGGQAKWDKNDDFAGDNQYPGAEDGVQRWATIDGELRTLYATLAGAYRFEGLRLSVGAGINFTESNIFTVRARTPQGNDDVVDAMGGVAEGRSLLDTSGFALAASVGVNWEAMPGLWVAASYQSQPGFGNSTQSGVLTNKFGAGATDAFNIRLEQELPDIIRVGGRFQPTPQMELRLAGEMQRWSVFEHQCLLQSDADPDAKCQLRENGTAFGDDAEDIIVNIPREWKDTYGVRAGASYMLSPELELNGGMLFETSAVPDKTIDASLPDSNKLFARAGVRWAAMPDQLILALTANNVFYFSHTVAPREAGSIGTMSPSTVPDGAGKYTQNVLFFNLGAEYRF